MTQSTATIVSMIFGLFGLLVGVTGLKVSVRAFRTNAAVNLRNKRMDVIMNANARYDEIYKTKISIIRQCSSIIEVFGVPGSSNESSAARNSIVDIKEEISLYYRRFWGLRATRSTTGSQGMSIRKP